MNTMKTMILKTGQILTLVAFVGVCIPTASAAVSIADLIQNQGVFISGDKLFDKFAFSSTGDMPDAADVLVEPFIDASDNFGIRLVSSFLDYDGGGASELRLSYRVTATDPNYRISGAAMQGNLAVIKTGSFEATETIDTVPAKLGIFDRVPGSTQLTDSDDFDSLFSEVDVELHLTAEATGEVNNAATASFIDQTFAQSVIPEPASLAVWCGMLLLIGGVPYVYRRLTPAISE